MRVLRGRSCCISLHLRLDAAGRQNEGRRSSPTPPSPASGGTAPRAAHRGLKQLAAALPTPIHVVSSCHRLTGLKMLVLLCSAMLTPNPTSIHAAQIDVWSYYFPTGENEEADRMTKGRIKYSSRCASGKRTKKVLVKREKDSPATHKADHVHTTSYPTVGNRGCEM